MGQQSRTSVRMAQDLMGVGFALSCRLADLYKTFAPLLHAILLYFEKIFSNNPRASASYEPAGNLCAPEFLNRDLARSEDTE